MDSLLPRLKEIDVKRLCGIQQEKVIGKRKERQEEADDVESGGEK